MRSLSTVTVADLGNGRRFTRRDWIVVSAVLFLLMVPTLAAPLGSDQALFFTAGETILRGGVPYRDFIDIKPPLIYYLYAGAIATFGHTSVSIRIFDIILQSIGLWIMIALVRRCISDGVAVLAALFYLLLYLGQGHDCLAQTESYVGLLGCSVAWILLYKRTVWGFLAVGGLVALLFLFKSTLAIVLIPVVITEIALVRQSIGKATTTILLIMGGFVIVTTAIAIPLLLAGAGARYAEVQRFTASYAATDWQRPALWLKNLCTELPFHLAVDFSIVFSLASVIGIAMSFSEINASSQENPASAKKLLLLRFCTLAMGALILTVVIEGKYSPWHLIRFYPFGAILAASGAMVAFTRGFRPTSATPRSFYQRLILIALLPPLILFSPLAGYGWRTAAVGFKSLQGYLGVAVTTQPTERGEHMEDAREIAKSIVPRYLPGDRMMVVTNFTGEIHYACGIPADYPIYHSVFMMAPYIPQSWRDQTRDYLLVKKPRFLVIQFDSPYPGLTGDSTTPDVALRRIPRLDSAIQHQYHTIATTRHTTILERIGR